MLGLFALTQVKSKGDRTKEKMLGLFALTQVKSKGDRTKDLTIVNS
jgi:hypothetical protein